MTYDQIKKTIKKDYTDLAHAMSGGRGNMKTFYLTFSKALKELDDSVSPFITSKEQFIEHIKYIEGRLDRSVYDAIIQYCKDKLDLDIRK